MKPLSLESDLNGHLWIGGVPVSELARKYGTPLYVLDEETIRTNCRHYVHALDGICDDFLVAYAGKANMTVGLLNILAEEQMGVDVVSGGELLTALKSHISPENIVFHGNNKSIEELRLALEYDIRIVLDNEQEMENLFQLLRHSDNKRARVMVRLKPEIEAHTHDYIKTGHIDSKFGIDNAALLPVIRRLAENEDIEFLGIHSHIGSQILDILPYQDLADIMFDRMRSVEEETGAPVRELNLGGGLGIRYVEGDNPPPVKDYLTGMVRRLKEHCQNWNVRLPKIIVEPGRSIIGQAGITIYTVGTIKSIPNSKDYLFVDGGMADNMRPLLYKSRYTFELANKANKTPVKRYSIAGRYCESGDVLAENVPLPEAEVGDLLVVYGTGAYNYSMASNYNRSRRPAMVLAGYDSDRLLVRRETFDDLLRYDVLE